MRERLFKLQRRPFLFYCPAQIPPRGLGLFVHGWQCGVHMFALRLLCTYKRGVVEVGLYWVTKNDAGVS